ncbi:MAG: hypothetical protein CVV49_07100 [Spirochaetae bacterium HGW-Spirochaetae-5]|nr:MAG: hypothetical protein CVV49_07100 [Spirochaetae bacterium HGW-Spirochaetae-5]
MISIINFLNRINLSRLRPRAEVSGMIVIVIFLLDLHRFGWWYSGNQCHMKIYGLPMLAVAGMPFVIYALASAVQGIISRGWYMVLYIFRIYLFLLVPGMINDITISGVFQEPVWYSPSIFRPFDFMFLKGIAAMMLLTGAYTAVLVLPIWIVVQVYKFLLRFPFMRSIARYF